MANAAAPTILHIATRAAWEEGLRAGAYRADSLDSEGFMHCSLPAQVVPSAERHYPGARGLVLLAIAVDRVEPEVRYEAASNGELYPHIYGPLNPAAVTQVVPFEPGPDGHFTLPPELAPPELR
ncbi:MAG: hypothetical protein QOF51_517 [Chloroflexota bacterium]|jgi:uncharacterized protein (DUF952 family)|nr:hypothetical protein [Chloroflexota bacterium]